MRKLNEITILGIALAVAIFWAACNRTSQAPNDQQIVASIQAKLNQDQDLQSLPLNVTSNHGVVTLTGTVNVPLEKLAVDDLAENTAGVKHVVDNLTVFSNSSTQTSAANTPPAAPPEKAAAPRHRRHASKQMAEAQNPASSGASQGPEQVPDSSLNSSQDNSQPANPTPSGNAAIAAPAAAPTPKTPPAPLAPPPPPPPPEQVTIPAGTAVSVQMIDSISSETAEPDQNYKASISAPVVMGGQMIVPRGANALVRVVQVQSAGHIEGQSELQLELARVTVNGKRYKVQSDYVNKVGQSRSKNSAEKIGGGAALGALLGGLLGHGKGAGIGAAIGAGAGTTDQEATHGGQVTIPSEAKIDFVLKAPVTVTLSSGH